MLVVEKNRLQAPRTSLTKKSCLTLIEAIEAELVEIRIGINDLIKQNPELMKKKLIKLKKNGKIYLVTKSIEF